MHRQRIAVAAIATGLAVVAAACSTSEPAESTQALPDPTPTTAVVQPTEPPEATPSEPTPAPLDDVADEEIVYGDRFPEVLSVEATPLDGSGWRFSVTLSSPYDTPQRYADAWRVLDGNDQELGVRVLTHDHASEQPFTRSHTIVVPVELTTVYVEGRDQGNGWSGQRFEVSLG